jgi:hypothetical protein
MKRPSSTGDRRRSSARGPLRAFAWVRNTICASDGGQARRRALGCRGELRTRRLNPGRYLPSGQASKQASVFRFDPATRTTAFHPSRMARSAKDH